MRISQLLKLYSPYAVAAIGQCLISCSGINPQGNVTTNSLVKANKDISFIDDRNPSGMENNYYNMDEQTAVEHESAELLISHEDPVIEKTKPEDTQPDGEHQDADVKNATENRIGNPLKATTNTESDESTYNEIKDEKINVTKPVTVTQVKPSVNMIKKESDQKPTSTQSKKPIQVKTTTTKSNTRARMTSKAKINMANWTTELNQTRNELSRVRTLTAVTLRDLSVEENLFSFNSKSKISVASNFKIYVLKALVEGIKQKRFTWSTKVTVRNDLKSFPSGIVQNWGAGTQTTVKQLAKLMISISDNSATDHLIDLIGRENILKSMEGINSFTLFNTPFLSTMEWFRMKTLNRAQVQNYQKMGVEGKKTYIKNLNATLPRSEVPGRWYGWTASRPKEVKSVEWFASSEDLCLAYRSILDHVGANKELLEILKAKTPFGLSLRDLNANYLGYKGGNETGVLTMSFLLKAKSGRWACLSVGVNDEDRPVNYSVVNPIFKRLILLSSRIINSKKP